MSQGIAEKTESERYAEIVANKELTASEAAITIFKEYAKAHPEVVALWSFGLGFILGWKLKLW